MRVFGPTAYQAMMRLPPAAIVRFAQIQGERQAAQHLMQLRIASMADQMEQGREYIPDPSEPKPKSRAHYSLKRFLAFEESLERSAEPWIAGKRQRDRRKAEQDAKWARAKAAMKGLQA